MGITLQQLAYPKITTNPLPTLSPPPPPPYLHFSRFLLTSASSCPFQKQPQNKRYSSRALVRLSMSHVNIIVPYYPLNRTSSFSNV